MTEIIRKNPDEAAQWMMSREQSTLLQEGEKMKNESVKHVRYGTGRAVEVVQNHMVVLFDGENGRKVFPYPDAFERFLCFDDPILQKRAEAAVMELKKKRTEEAKQRLVVYQLYEAKRKQEQTELLKKRRKAARERLAREKMAKVI